MCTRSLNNPSTPPRLPFPFPPSPLPGPTLLSRAPWCPRSLAHSRCLGQQCPTQEMPCREECVATRRCVPAEEGKDMFRAQGRWRSGRLDNAAAVFRRRAGGRPGNQALIPWLSRRQSSWRQSGGRGSDGGTGRGGARAQAHGGNLSPGSCLAAPARLPVVVRSCQKSSNNLLGDKLFWLDFERAVIWAGRGRFGVRAKRRDGSLRGRGGGGGGGGKFIQS